MREEKTYAWTWVESLRGEEVNDGLSFGPAKPNFASAHGTTFEYAALYTQHVVKELEDEVERHKQRAETNAWNHRHAKQDLQSMTNARDALQAEI